MSRSHTSRLARANRARRKRFNKPIRPEKREYTRPNTGASFNDILAFVVKTLNSMFQQKLITEYVRSDTSEFAVTRGSITITFLVVTKAPNRPLAHPFIVISNNLKANKLRSFVRRQLDNAEAARQ